MTTYSARATKRIRKLRETYSGASIAEQSGISEEHINYVARGERRISTDLAERVLAVDESCLRFRAHNRESDRAEVLRLWGEGLKPAGIVRQIGCSPTFVYRTLANAGVRETKRVGPRKRVPAEMKMLALELSEAGVSAKRVAESVGVCERTVTRWRAAHG